MGVALLLLGCGLWSPKTEESTLLTLPCAQGAVRLVQEQREASWAAPGRTQVILRTDSQDLVVRFGEVPAHLRTGLGPPMERLGAPSNAPSVQLFLDPVFVEDTERQQIQACLAAHQAPLYQSVAEAYGTPKSAPGELILWQGFPAQLRPVFFGPDQTKIVLERDGELRFIAVPTASRALHTHRLGQVDGTTWRCCLPAPEFPSPKLSTYQDDAGKTLMDYLGPPQPPVAEPSEGAKRSGLAD